MKQYEKYKDSGVEWLGEIPEHWEVEKLKFSGKIYAGLSGKSGVDFSKEPKKNHKPYIPFTNIYNNTVIDVNDYHFVKIDEYEQQNYVKNNDLLFLMSSETLEDIGKNALFKDKTSVFLNSFCKGFRIYDKNVYPEYLNYLLLASPYREYFAMVARGFTRINLKQEYVLNMPILKLDLKEQQKIATFLDEKTAKIDKAIELKERTIALLKERKQIVIQDLVTGKKVWNQEKQEWTKPIQVKDSGVEWIGEIPEEWEVKKLFGTSQFIRGNTAFSKDEMLSNGDYVAVQYGKAYQIDEINEEYEYYINNEFYKDSQVVNQGDTIIISTSETIEDLGHSVFYNRNDVGLLGGEQMMLKPNTGLISGKYLFYSSKVFTKELRKFATGIKVYRFNINDLKTIYISVPPTEEQAVIVSHIESQSSKIDQAISIQEQQIEKLKEYKATLIDSAVTGKVKVNEGMKE